MENYTMDFKRTKNYRTKSAADNVFKAIKNSLPTYVLLFPTLVLFALFSIYPIIWALKFCLYNYDGATFPVYVGLENFKNLFNFKEMTINPDSYYKLYWTSWTKTFAYAGIKTVIEIPISFVCAVLISNKIRGQKIFRTLFYMPQILPSFVMFMLFGIMLNPYNGVLNQFFSNIGLFPKNYSFFLTARSAFIVGIFSDIWISFGLNMLFFIAGLMNIPKDIYESSCVDGANKLQQFIYITIPMMARMAQIIIMLSLVACLRSVGSYFILTQGGPNHGTELTFLYIYHIFFPGGGNLVGRYGFGAAAAIVSAVIIGCISFIYMKVTDKFQHD